MMNDALCTYDGRRDDVLVAYLYDDIEPAERDAFERHLTACLPCRNELDALTDVRAGLAAWAAPDTADGIGGTAPHSTLRIVNSGAAPVRPGGWRVIADAPLWMQAAAAMLVVAASLGLANINLTYARGGGTLTTGWLRTSGAVVPTPVSPAPALAALAAENAQLRADMAALRRQVEDVKLQTVAAAAPKTDDGSMTRQVRLQLQESERRQQREFDLRFAEMARDFQSQRQSDLVKFDRVLGLYQNRTGMQVAQQQQQLKSLAQRVSQQP